MGVKRTGSGTHFGDEGVDREMVVRIVAMNRQSSCTGLLGTRHAEDEQS